MERIEKIREKLEAAIEENAWLFENGKISTNSHDAISSALFDAVALLHLSMRYKYYVTSRV